MNQASSHLTDAQIKDYVQDSFTGPPAERLEAHLTDCESCLDRLLHAERIHLGLLEGNGMKQTPYPGCPPEETLQELAAGICASDTAQTTTEHAAHCNYCGPLLNRYLKEFSEDVQPEDAAVLRELKTSTPRWQKNFIGENFHPEKQLKGWFSGLWPRLAIATAAGVAAAVAAFSYLQPNDLVKAQQLVASAYLERRTTEMRLTGVPYAQYSPLPVERGGDAAGSMAYQRPSLLRAGAAVGDKLRNGSNVDPRWLQIKARVDLLEATPASAADAQQILEKARSEGLNDPGLDIDLAASSFQRASTEDDADLSATINLLRAALDDSKISHQEQLVALFDLGIAYQKSKMFDLAIETWNKYLQLDSSSEWANEARERLDKAKEAAPPKTQSYLDTQTPLFFFGPLERASSVRAS